MKKFKIFVIIITLVSSFSIIKSQSIILDLLDEYPYEYTDNGIYYIKDTENNLDKFVGTWHYIEGNKKFEFIVSKVVKYHFFDNYPPTNYYEDGLIYTYKKYENGNLIFSASKDYPVGSLKNEYLYKFLFSDAERRSTLTCRGCDPSTAGPIIVNLYFSINPNNPNESQFKLSRYSSYGIAYDYVQYQGQPFFSVPEDVILIKVE